MDLIRNLRAGLRLACLQRVSPDDFRATPDQLVGLALFAALFGIVCDWLVTTQPLELGPYAAGTHATWLVLCLLIAYVAARESRLPRAFLTTAVMLLSPLAVAWVLYAGLVTLASHFEPRLDAFVEPGALRTLFLLWMTPATLRSIQLGSGLRLSSAASLSLAHIAVAALVLSRLPPPWYFWPATDHTAWEDEREAWPEIDAETLLHTQAARVRAVLEALEPGRPGEPALYFVGFGADATQGVFMREVLYVRQLFEERFDAAGRAVALVNHHDTMDEVPLATASNLADVLGGIGRRMDADDVLFLFLTGHGSRDHEIAVEFPTLPLNRLGPERLAAMLDEAGIPWRVVVVSACYSGGFIEPLADDHTLVLTAARADRRSFGCSNEADFTYFGRAYFAEALPGADGFVAAFEHARTRIDALEKEEGKTPSEPQMAGASPILERLAVIERRLAGERIESTSSASVEGTQPPEPDRVSEEVAHPGGATAMRL